MYDACMPLPGKHRRRCWADTARKDAIWAQSPSWKLPNRGREHTETHIYPQYSSLRIKKALHVRGEGFHQIAETPFQSDMHSIDRLEEDRERTHTPPATRRCIEVAKDSPCGDVERDRRNWRDKRNK